MHRSSGRVLPALCLWLTLIGMVAFALVCPLHGLADPGITVLPPTMTTLPAPGSTQTVQLLPGATVTTTAGGGSSTVNQGAPGSTASPWPILPVPGSTVTMVPIGPLTASPIGTTTVIPAPASTVTTVPAAGATTTVLVPGTVTTSPAAGATTTVAVPGGVTATQGPPGSTLSPWPVQIQTIVPTVTVSPAAGATTTVQFGATPTVNIGTISATPAVNLVTYPQASALNSQASTSVSTSATQVLAVFSGRHCGTIVNAGTVACYIGDSAVVSGATAQAHGGLYLAPGGSFSLFLLGGYTGSLYCITASGTTIIDSADWLHRGLQLLGVERRRVRVPGHSGGVR